MRALAHEGTNGMEGLSYRELDKPEPAQGEVRVKLMAAGLNHRDLFVLHRHNSADPALVIGSDGAGIIDAVGEGVESSLIGKEVMINPGLGWRENSDAPPAGFEIVGLPYHGTFAEYITIPAENTVAKPGFLTWEDAGVTSLAGITAYRALFTRGKLKEGMKVFIPGIGGGVATFLLQFAVAAGAEVYVSSRSSEKRDAALKLGAKQAVDSNEDWQQALGDIGMDLIIESVGAATFNQSMALLRKGGTIVTFGSSTGDTFQFNLREFFYGQFNLLGSTMGSAEEYADMLSFIDKHNIKPVLDEVYSLDQYETAFTRLEEAKQLGKIAFRISE
ncbi:zinc-binding dehydrogenase [Cytobacillus gottheilii]|uniref:zinc-binding dehydrogenase n=1 Tax=Cytobacillus gottheilii TaxID=859144 RepID=UPI0009BABA4A|nr:zinc-binding dehydrogenase [Cytobacillus gottheilii]